ncbi:hypothetical protein [Lacticaseibacillus saniviri]|uniref:hypothetical protein n=1 Tax=Lacticaseibacillus saniviri TaxID=931533 RepID=UPI0006D1E9D1|nr:hypothetical protein [Lacticaseibacillus saniviri]
MTRSHHSNSFKFSTLLASSVVLSGLLLVGPSLPVTTTHAAQSTVTRDASTQAAYAINPPNLEMIAKVTQLSPAQLISVTHRQALPLQRHSTDLRDNRRSMSMRMARSVFN